MILVRAACGACVLVFVCLWASLSGWCVASMTSAAHLCWYSEGHVCVCVNGLGILPSCFEMNIHGFLDCSYSATWQDICLKSWTLFLLYISTYVTTHTHNEGQKVPHKTQKKESKCSTTRSIHLLYEKCYVNKVKVMEYNWWLLTKSSSAYSDNLFACSCCMPEWWNKT